MDKSLNFNVLGTTINHKDFMGQTPLYLLCEKGFRKKADKPKSRREILKRLIKEKAEWAI